MREDEKKPLATVSVDLDKYDLMALDQALEESRASGWSSDGANDRALITNKLKAAAAKLFHAPTPSRRAAEDAEHERESHAEELAEITAERDEARADLARLRAEHAAALDAARRERAEGMREVVKAEIHAAFHYNDPPDDGRERPIAPRAGEWEAHQTLRKLLSRVCVVLTEGGAS